MVPPKKVGFDHRHIVRNALLGEEHKLIDDPGWVGFCGREQHVQFIEHGAALRMAPGDERLPAQPMRVQPREVAQQDEIRVQIKRAIVVGENLVGENLETAVFHRRRTARQLNLADLPTRGSKRFVRETNEVHARRLVSRRPQFVVAVKQGGIDANSFASRGSFRWCASGEIRLVLRVEKRPRGVPLRGEVPVAIRSSPVFVPMPARILQPGGAEIGKAFDGEQRPALTPSPLDGLQGGEGPGVFASAQQRLEGNHNVAVVDTLGFRLE